MKRYKTILNQSLKNIKIDLFTYFPEKLGIKSKRKKLDFNI